MSIADAADRLRLIRSANVGPITYRQLLRRFGTARAAIAAIPELAARGGLRQPRLADPAAIERELARVATLDAHHLFIDTADYPQLLAEVETAPPVLVVAGDTAMLHRPCVAVIGARNASATACRFARSLAHELAGAGLTIVSGLARGIDTAAHVGAMDGATAGVIASGIDIAFPRENEALQRAMASRQLVIAEQPPGTEPLARHFPSRNRIIAGLSAATVVVEAATRSGSLITARLANEYGREVLAVPGSPLDQRAQGCNQLIRDGATLIQSAADVLEAVRPVDARMVRQPGRTWRAEGTPSRSGDLFGDADAVDADARDRQRVHALLGPTAVPVDELARQSHVPLPALQFILLELELAGRLVRSAGDRVALDDGARDDPPPFV